MNVLTLATSVENRLLYHPLYGITKKPSIHKIGPLHAKNVGNASFWPEIWRIMSSHIIQVNWRQKSKTKVKLIMLCFVLPGMRPYACNECDKSFLKACLLDHHKRAVHQLLRPFSCKECDKCFTSAGVLKKHLKVHERASAKKENDWD